MGPAAQATSTIMNDDGTPTVPTVNISDAVALEGTNAVFTVSLSAPSESDVSVHYKTAPTAGANAATAGADYPAMTDTVLTFHGTTSQTISIPLTPDQLTEGNETFQVQVLESDWRDTRRARASDRHDHGPGVLVVGERCAGAGGERRDFHGGLRGLGQ